MTINTSTRNCLAHVLRRLPPFRGKGRLGDFLQRHLTNYRSDHECLVDFRMKDGTVMRVDLRSPTEKHAFWTGQYDGAAVRQLGNCLRPGSVALDVGANIGFYSIPLGKRCADLSGALYAAEPVRPNYDRLVENVHLNGLERVVRPLNLAVGETDGVVELSWGDDYPARTGNAVALGGNVRGRATASARIARLDTLADEQEIDACDLIKADIEGGEFDLLKGGQAFLRRARPLVYLELNYPWMEQRGWSLADLTRLAASLGYRVYRQVGAMFLAADESGAGIENALMVPEGTDLEWLARGQFALP
jgi:FkbM family methyltransferase